jgi:hypothetical protein
MLTNSDLSLIVALRSAMNTQGRSERQMEELTAELTKALERWNEWNQPHEV